MARATSSPYCALQRVHSQSGVLRPGASRPRQHAFAFARYPPQHGIDQRLEMHRLAVGRRPDGWRRPPRHAARTFRIRIRRRPAARSPSPVPPCAAPAAWRRNAAITRLQLAEMAQGLAGQGAREACIARRQVFQGVELRIQRAVLAQHLRREWRARPCARPGLRDPPLQVCSSPGTGLTAPAHPPWRAGARCVPPWRDGWRTDPLNAAMQRIDDEHMRGGGIGVGGRVSRSGARGWSICRQRIGQPERPAGQFRAGAVGFEFARAADRRLHQHGGDGRQQRHQQHADQAQRIAPRRP